jgi:hypothetical protein
VADAKVVSAFWDGTTCHSLVHELSREQPKTTKELLNVATRHASGEEAIGAAFTLAKASAAAGGHRIAPPPPISPSEAPKRALRAGRGGKSVACAISP